jgi:ATP-dependent helicase Lhr and Lhr-like helicase
MARRKQAPASSARDLHPAAKSQPVVAPIEAWFAQQGWTPMPFQRQAWQAYLAGESGLIQVPTGSGKTYAAVMGPIAEMLNLAPPQASNIPGNVHGNSHGNVLGNSLDGDRGKSVQTVQKPGQPPQPTPRAALPGTPPRGLRLLYLTPLRALSRDLALAIREPIEAMGWPLQVAIRNGDTSSHERSKQLRSPPQILITTPESLSLLLANGKAPELFGALQGVILDEWHELMSSKRGVQAELCLGHLRSLQPTLRTWAISATLGNLEEAAQTAVGLEHRAPIIRSRPQARHGDHQPLPESVDTFPWAGHLGLRMFETLVAALDMEKSTLIFTNTRNQAERWYQALRFALPEEMEENCPAPRLH